MVWCVCRRFARVDYYLQGYFTRNGAMLRTPQYQSSNPVASDVLNHKTKKNTKACISYRIYCTQGKLYHRYTLAPDITRL